VIASTRTIGWWDCAAGVAGDMLLGALVDLGVPLAYLQAAVAALPIEPVTLRAEPTNRHAIGATKVDVDAPPSPHHRHWREIRQMLSTADLPPGIVEPALDAFARIARAEAAVHRIDPEDVAFHEVGALDALTDIAGSCAGVHWLREHRGLERLCAGPVALGSGTTRAAHGAIPLPGPAVLGIVAEAGLPVLGGGLPYEACTPTGAALIAALTTEHGPMPPMRVLATGTGAGDRDPREAANLTRLVLGAPIDHSSDDTVAPLRGTADEEPAVPARTNQPPRFPTHEAQRP
jgi:uncharacterized protein (TIGR00299 family) protein